MSVLFHLSCNYFIFYLSFIDISAPSHNNFPFIIMFFLDNPFTSKGTDKIGELQYENSKRVASLSSFSIVVNWFGSILMEF